MTEDRVRGGAQDVEEGCDPEIQPVPRLPDARIRMITTRDPWPTPTVPAGARSRTEQPTAAEQWIEVITPCRRDWSKTMKYSMRRNVGSRE